MLRSRIPAVLLPLLLSVAACVAQTEDLSQKLDHAVAAFESKRHFMGSVLVAKSGKILLDKGYGMADLEWNVPNTPDGKFRLGSITKQFTATATMQLAAQHKLSVNDKACKYFEQCPEAWKQITIHQLLSHTSGIPSYTGMPDFPKPKFLRVPLMPPEILLLTKISLSTFHREQSGSMTTAVTSFLGSFSKRSRVKSMRTI